MKTKLITALRLAASAIENRAVKYDWYRPQYCNCGIVACCVLGIKPPSLRRRIMRLAGRGVEASWAGMADCACPRAVALFKSLFLAGFTRKDFKQLEDLSNPNVIRRMRKAGMKGEIRRTVCDDAVAYMRAWADLLAEEDQKQQLIHVAMPHPASNFLVDLQHTPLVAA